MLPKWGANSTLWGWKKCPRLDTCFDHVSGIVAALTRGKSGQKYNIGSLNELRNIDIVTAICKVFDDNYPRKNLPNHIDLLRYVEDRKGHDFRYAVDNSKTIKELEWVPSIKFEDGLLSTVEWYIENKNNFLSEK